MIAPTVMVMGVNGFVGKHLTIELLRQGCTILGVGQEPQASAIGLSQYFACNLLDKDAVSKLPLKDVDSIINLAGFARVGDSFTQAGLYQKVNVGVLSVVGEELVRQGLTPRLIAVSTGAVYDANQSLPLNESSDLINPGKGSPYAQSKISMEEAARDLRKQGLECIVVRPFNHIGPGQEPGFLVPDLYAKLMAAKTSGEPVIVGNLTTRRDYTDVRDVVRAYTKLALSPSLAHTTYNVCSGTSTTGQTILDTLLQKTGTVGKVTIKQDSSLLRPDDPKDLYGSHERLKDEVGWRPKISLTQTIGDFVAAKKI